MQIPNPRNFIPRYANIIGAGLKNIPNPVPTGRANNALYNAAQIATNHRLETLGGGLAAIAANQMLGNPVFGAVDFLSFGMTDLKPDRPQSSPPTQSILIQQPGMQRPSQVGVPTQPTSIPGLNEEDRKRQRQYLERKVATDILTIQALQSQPGMGGYEGYA